MTTRELLLDSCCDLVTMANQAAEMAEDGGLDSRDEAALAARLRPLADYLARFLDRKDAEARSFKTAKATH